MVTAANERRSDAHGRASSVTRPELSRVCKDTSNYSLQANLPKAPVNCIHQPWKIIGSSPRDQLLHW